MNEINKRLDFIEFIQSFVIFHCQNSKVSRSEKWSDVKLRGKIRFIYDICKTVKKILHSSSLLKYGPTHAFLYFFGIEKNPLSQYLHLLVPFRIPNSMNFINYHTTF